MSARPVKKTYFGIAALISGILCALSLLFNFGASSLEIPRKTFDQLNNLTALLYCVLTQATIILGVIGHTRRKDSKNFSRVGIALALVPFLFMLGKFASSYLK